jgi:hypothetical protein
MTTENLPPVATAGGPPTATGGTILVVPAEAAAFDQEFLDNYDLDAEGGDDYTLSQKWYTIAVETSPKLTGLLARLA